MSAQNRLDRVQQRITAEGLVEECDGAGPEAPLANLLVPMSSENDGRNADVRGREMPEEVEAAHSGHPQIEHQAPGGLALGGGQELFRRGVHLVLDAYRQQTYLMLTTLLLYIVTD